MTILKFLEFIRILVASALVDDVNEVVSQYEGDSLASDAKFLLEVAEDVSKVDMEELAVLLHHDIV